MVSTSSIPSTRRNMASFRRARFYFGLCVLEILGGKNADLNTAAPLLHYSSNDLLKITRGQLNISKEEIEKYKWDETFEWNYKEGWGDKKNRKAYRKYAAQLTDRPLRREIPENHEPKDEESFGHTVWEIIGGPNADIVNAAKLLDDILPSHLNSIMHSEKRISQKAAKKWRKILHDNFPDTPEHLWREYDKRYAALPQRSGRRSPEPANKDSYGHALWVLLGGPKGHVYVKQSAEYLGTSPSSLSDIFSGKWKPSKEWLDQMHWTDILEIKYSKKWGKSKSGRKEWEKQLAIYKDRESKLTTYSHKGNAPHRETKSLESKQESRFQGKTL